MLRDFLLNWLVPFTGIMVCIAMCSILLMPISLGIGHIVGAILEARDKSKEQK